MSQDFIGSKISLTSKSAIRYVGVLTAIDHVASTISLEKVQSFGTEDRRPDAFIPANPNVYDGVVFRAQDITDLQVLESPSAPAPTPAPTFQDPAIVSSSKASSQPAPAASINQPRHDPSQANATRSPPTAVNPGRPTRDLPDRPQQQQSQQQSQRRESNLEKVERAIGELTATRGGASGGISGRGGFGGEQHFATSSRAPYQQQQRQQQRLSQASGPDADYSAEYDFQEMNKKFEVLRSADAQADKAKKSRNGTAVLSSSRANGVVEEQDESDSDEDDDEEDPVNRGKGATDVASPGKGPSNVYNKSQSFFDTVSSDVLLAATDAGQNGHHASSPGSGFGGGRGRGGGGRGGAGGYRWNRNDQLAQNMSTFGEAGEGLGIGPQHGMRGRGGGRGGRGGGARNQPTDGHAPR